VTSQSRYLERAGRGGGSPTKRAIGASSKPAALSKHQMRASGEYEVRGHWRVESRFRPCARINRPRRRDRLCPQAAARVRYFASRVMTASLDERHGIAAAGRSRSWPSTRRRSGRRTPPSSRKQRQDPGRVNQRHSSGRGRGWAIGFTPAAASGRRRRLLPRRRQPGQGGASRPVGEAAGPVDFGRHREVGNAHTKQPRARAGSRFRAGPSHCAEVHVRFRVAPQLVLGEVTCPFVSATSGCSDCIRPESRRWRRAARSRRTSANVTRSPKMRQRGSQLVQGRTQDAVRRAPGSSLGAESSG